MSTGIRGGEVLERLADAGSSRGADPGEQERALPALPGDAAVGGPDRGGQDRPRQERDAQAGRRRPAAAAAGAPGRGPATGPSVATRTAPARTTPSSISTLTSDASARIARTGAGLEADAGRARPLAERAEQERAVDLRVLGGPVGAREAREVEAGLQHVVVEELAGEAVVAQHVLALGELRGLGAVAGEEEAAARRVAAVAPRLLDERAQPQVVLAPRRPDEPRLRAADRPGHLRVRPPGPEQGEAEAERPLLGGSGAEDDDPRPAAGELERGRERGQAGAHHGHVRLERRVPAQEAGDPHAARTAAARASSSGVSGRPRSDSSGAGSDTSSQSRQSSSSGSIPW